ncbi:hypothetical protein BH09BAC2_BH09BAC2_22560 [soil metagenome]
MKQIFTLLSITFFSITVFAQTTANPAGEINLPSAVLTLPESEYTFGKIPQGKPVTHIFYIKNTGTAPLILDDVQASCGCTTPVWNKEPIAAGATGKITVGYNAAGEGSFDKMVTVKYNKTLTRQIKITGEVWRTPAESAPANMAIVNLKTQ